MSYQGDLPLPLSYGMTGDATLNTNGVLYGNGTSPFGVTNTGTNGTLLAGTTGSAPSFSSTSGGNFSFATASVGASVTLTAENTDNTNAASHAALIIQDGGTSGGDMRSQFVISGATSNMVGVVRSSGNFMFNAGSTNFAGGITLVPSGTVRKTRTVCFLSFLPTDVNNATGQSATYTLGSGTALTEIFDQAASITTGGTLTSPVTGRYDLRAAFRIIGVTIATKFNAAIVTSNRTYLQTISQTASALNQSIFCSAICDMDAADTCTFQAASTGEAADTDDIDGASGTLVTWCCGNLVA